MKPLVGGPKTLPPGATWTGKLTILGIPRFKPGIAKQGQYGFALTADPGKAIAEFDEQNNKLLTYGWDPCFEL